MRTQIIGYKFFKKGECKISENSVSDNRGFSFEEGKELSVSFDKEWKEDKLLPFHSSGNIINSAIFEKGIRFNQLPTNQYQYFPHCGGEFEDFCFEVVTFGYWFNWAPYKSSLICAESVKVLRKLTAEEVKKIFQEWKYDRNIGREKREIQKNISPIKFEDLIGKTIQSAIRYKLKDIPNDAGYSGNCK